MKILNPVGFKLLPHGILQARGTGCVAASHCCTRLCSPAVHRCAQGLAAEHRHPQRAAGHQLAQRVVVAAAQFEAHGRGVSGPAAWTAARDGAAQGKGTRRAVSRGSRLHSVLSPPSSRDPVALNSASRLGDGTRSGRIEIRTDQPRPESRSSRRVACGPLFVRATWPSSHSLLVARAEG